MDTSQAFLDHFRSVANYYLEFFWSATTETVSLLGGWWALLWAIALFAGTYLVLGWTQEKEAAEGHLKVFVASSVVILFFFLIFFFFNMIMAPVRLMQHQELAFQRIASEKDREIEGLKVKIKELSGPQEGRVELRSIFFQPIAVYSDKSEFPNWGYDNPILFSSVENGIQSYKLINDLVLWDSVNQSAVIGRDRMLTTAECALEAERLGLDPEIRKWLHLEIGFRNTGESPIRRVATRVEFVLSEAETSQNPIFQGSPPIGELLGGNEFHIKPYLYLSLNSLLPRPLKLKISVSLSHEERSKAETYDVMYDLVTDTWNWN